MKEMNIHYKNQNIRIDNLEKKVEMLHEMLFSQLDLKDDPIISVKKPKK